MSEEKKLDEKALEEVSGGFSKSESNSFLVSNCFKCSHYIHRTCPYGSITDALADAIEGLSKGTKLCPKKVAL